MVSIGKSLNRDRVNIHFIGRENFILLNGLCEKKGILLDCFVYLRINWQNIFATNARYLR